MPLVRSEAGSIWRVTLARPDARNAVSLAMAEALLSALADAAADPDARVVVLAGEGADFCAGADLQELEATASGGSAGVDYGGFLEPVMAAIAQHPLPVVAKLHGAVLGAGCQMAVACDLAVAASDARFGIPAARLGIVISFENVERLVLAVGPRRAGEILLTGAVLSGERAEAWGLVNAAVAPEDLDARVEDLAASIAAAAPLSVRGSKRGIREVLATMSVDRASDGYRTGDFDMMAAAAFASEDLREGIRAFRERRPPMFRGA